MFLDTKPNPVFWVTVVVPGERSDPKDRERLVEICGRQPFLVSEGAFSRVPYEHTEYIFRDLFETEVKAVRKTLQCYGYAGWITEFPGGRRRAI